MSQDDVTQIRVGNSPVGVIGLKDVLEDMAGTYGERPDQEIIEELLNRLSKKNYIPEKVKEKHYGNQSIGSGLPEVRANGKERERGRL